MNKRRQVFISIFILLFSLSACSKADTGFSLPESGVVDPYSDVRSLFHTEVVLEKHQYEADEMYTLFFNEGTVFKGNEELKTSILESGRNPGLNVRKLHEEGVTGSGVTVAIIDQPLFLNHPEYDGKIKAYHTVGLEGIKNPMSMHGPAVTSLLAGDTIGTAPEVTIYYVAFASWKGDAALGAEALDWLIEQNTFLDEDDKIRVVSVSADFSGSELYKNHDAWAASVQKAEDASIMVLDGRAGYDACLIWPSHFSWESPEDITQCTYVNKSGEAFLYPENFVDSIRNTVDN